MEILTSQDQILSRWIEYFERLTNEENYNEIETKDDVIEGIEKVVDPIDKREVRVTMEIGKAVSPNNIAIEAWKCSGDFAAEFSANF